MEIVFEYGRIVLLLVRCICHHNIGISKLLTSPKPLTLCIARPLYNLFLHPLRSYPGPWYARASVVPYTYWLATGELTSVARKIHEKYGDSVRLSPNKLSFIQSQVWRDIHGEGFRAYELKVSLKERSRPSV